MKCFALLLLLFIISLSCFAQEVEKKKMPVWKKQVLIGSAITVGGAGALTASVFSFQAAFKLLDEDETVPGIGALVGSCVLAGAGVAGIIAGPIVLAAGVRQKKIDKEGINGSQDISFHFVPIHSKQLDRYQASLNSRKFLSLSLMF